VAKKKKSRHLAILLIKNEYTAFKDTLENSDSLHEYKLKNSLPFTGALFVQPTQDNPPTWLEFLQSGIKEKIDFSNNASNSAVLFVRSSSRLFAITFGHGRYLLKQEALEQNFGLKVALNTVDPRRLRSIDIRSFEELPLYTRQQASAASSINVFNIDIDSDLLRAVTGEPTDTDFGLRITGADSLALNSRVDFEDIGRKCEQILTAYKSNKYKTDFAWVDHLQSVRDPRITEELDKHLLDMINNSNTEDIYLCPPEPLDWLTIEGFRYSPESRSNEWRTDLDLSEYLDLLPAEGSITSELLRNHRVSVKFVEVDEPAAKWSVYECIVSQIKLGEYLYVLTGGQWFQIENSFAGRVLRDLKSIPNQDEFLLEAKSKEKEEEYNERIAGKVSGFVLMDQKLIHSEGAKTPIEFCDLFSKNKQIIHVKRKTQSAMLSHLFGQGTVSAELFLRDDTFRDSLRTVLKSQKPNLSSLVPKNRPMTSDYEVVYAIITDGQRKWPDSLPFFSQLYIRQNARRLRDFGYRVLLSRIKLKEA
jgi:uncharacterized protein (TIGR04141 family)